MYSIWIKRILLSTFGLAMLQSVHAQEQYQLWFRSTLQVPIKKKIFLDIEFQNRKQNSYSSQNSFSKNKMYSFRTWGHYEFNNNLKFSISPLGIFSNYALIDADTDLTWRPKLEYRISAALELKQKLHPTISLINRTAIEYRLFPKNQNKLRLRHRIGLKYQINTHIHIQVYDELFLNIPLESMNNIFDQNRLGVVLELTLNPQVKLDLGYIRNNKVSSQINNPKEHVLLANIWYKIPSNKLKNKKRGNEN